MMTLEGKVCSVSGAGDGAGGRWGSDLILYLPLALFYCVLIQPLTDTDTTRISVYTKLKLSNVTTPHTHTHTQLSQVSERNNDVHAIAMSTEVSTVFAYRH